MHKKSKEILTREKNTEIPPKKQGKEAKGFAVRFHEKKFKEWQAVLTVPVPISVSGKTARFGSCASSG